MTLETSGQRAVEHEDGTDAARVIVVGADAGRIAQYQAALGLAELPYRTTLDTDEAQSLIAQHPLEVLVLDVGLRRLALLQLYSLAREIDGGADVQVLFVGQEGETGPDDHFLPGEPSPVTVASWVSDLLAGVPEAPPLDLGLDDDEPVAADEADVTAAKALEAPTPAPAAAHVASTPESTTAETQVPDVDAQSDAAPLEQAAQPDTTAPVDRAPDTTKDVAAPDVTVVPTPDEVAGRRSYIVLVRIGLVLFILGLLLVLVRLEWNPPAIAPPASAPTVVPEATPTQTGYGLPPARLSLRRLANV